MTQTTDHALFLKSDQQFVLLEVCTTVSGTLGYG